MESLLCSRYCLGERQRGHFRDPNGAKPVPPITLGCWQVKSPSLEGDKHRGRRELARVTSAKREPIRSPSLGPRPLALLGPSSPQLRAASWPPGLSTVTSILGHPASRGASREKLLTVFLFPTAGLLKTPTCGRVEKVYFRKLAPEAATFTGIPGHEKHLARDTLKRDVVLVSTPLGVEIHRNGEKARQPRASPSSQKATCTFRPAPAEARPGLLLAQEGLSFGQTTLNHTAASLTGPMCLVPGGGGWGRVLRETLPPVP